MVKKHCNAPVETRFPFNRKDHTKKHPHGYLTPILKKLLAKKMSVNDPEVRKVLAIKTGTKAELKKIIMLRYILNALQGENHAIEGIMDRMDGKVGNQRQRSTNARRSYGVGSAGGAKSQMAGYGFRGAERHNFEKGNFRFDSSG